MSDRQFQKFLDFLEEHLGDFLRQIGNRLDTPIRQILTRQTRIWRLFLRLLIRQFWTRIEPDLQLY